MLIFIMDRILLSRVPIRHIIIIIILDNSMAADRMD